MRIKVSNYISQFLVDNGITDVFTVTGGGAMHLNDALGHQKGLRCIYNHHEQACSIAAEGYARMTNRLPVVCVTTGPGGTNAITGVVRRMARFNTYVYNIWTSKKRNNNLEYKSTFEAIGRSRI